MSARLPFFVAATGLLVVTAADAQRDSETRLELFLMIGQSNMAGRGRIEATDRVPIPGVFVLDKNFTWRSALDPLHDGNPSIDAAGLGRSFARVLVLTNPSVRIGLIPAALGGTNLEQWRPGGELYRAAVSRTRYALKSGTLRGILWHQGESDAQQEDLAGSYASRFGEFIRTLRQDLGAPQAPIIVGQLGEFAKVPFASRVNEQLASLPLKVPRCAFVSSAGLADKGDQVHFDTHALRELGRRYAFAFLSLESSWMTLDFPSDR